MKLRALPHTFLLLAQAPEQSATSQALSLLQVTLITESKSFPAPWVPRASLEWSFPNADWVQRQFHHCAVCACQNPHVGRVIWVHMQAWCNYPSCHCIVSAPRVSSTCFDCAWGCVCPGASDSCLELGVLLIVIPSGAWAPSCSS